MQYVQIASLIYLQTVHSSPWLNIFWDSAAGVWWIENIKKETLFIFLHSEDVSHVLSL